MNEIKCKNCKYCEFENGNGSPNRYYCVHRLSKSVLDGTRGNTIICKTERRSEEFTIKRTPRWCPLKEMENK